MEPRRLEQETPALSPAACLLGDAAVPGLPVVCQLSASCL